VKLLIFGANSQLGCELVSLLSASDLDFACLSTEDVDVLKPKEVTKAVSRINPTQLINVSTYTNLQKAESDAEAARRCDLVNTEGVTALARVCEQLSIPIIHHSSSYVFDGTKKDTYLEDDETNPVCRYGKSKWYGERTLREETARHIILRTDWLFSNNRPHYFQMIIDEIKKNNGRIGVVDNRFSPTHAGDVARVILGIARQVDCNADAWGTYHYSALQPVNQDQFVLHCLEEAAKHDPELAEKMTEMVMDLLPVEPPYIRNTSLNCEKIMMTFGIKQRSRAAGVTEVIESLYGIAPKPVEAVSSPVLQEATLTGQVAAGDSSATKKASGETGKNASKEQPPVKSPRRVKRPAKKAATRKKSPSP
jgi:dTDP-4-dehydrorhamnose reductase